MGKARAAAIITMLMLIYIGLFFALCYLNIKDAKDMRGQRASMYVKILINHYTVLMLLSSINSKYPSYFNEFFSSSNAPDFENIFIYL